MNLETVTQKLSAIKAQGYVKSRRTGPTGIGYTLETLLGIKENNISSPDLGAIELKAYRATSGSLVTLFTFNRKVWKVAPLDAIRTYGSKDKDGRLGLYYTMKRSANSAGLFLSVGTTSVEVRHLDGSVIAQWTLSKLVDKFNKKVRQLLLVKAQVEERDGDEYFFFDRARILYGGTSLAILKNLFETENILLDLRLHDAKTRARNHGTGFRISESNLESLYTKSEELSL